MQDDVTRTVVAFLLAPLAVPIIFVAFVKYTTIGVDDAGGGPLVLNITTLLTSLAYVVTLGLGVPAYIVLRACRLSAFWIAPLLGFVAGAAAQAVIVYHIVPFLPLLGTLRAVMTGGGLMGAVVGAIFWLIDRPDRRSAQS